MRVAYLGPPGTYTEKALEQKFPKAVTVPLPNIGAVFDDVASKESDFGFVPIENIINGPVVQTLDNLLKHASKLYIVDAALLAIEHAVGALPEHGKITKILSKDTALEQCSDYLNRSYPHAIPIAMESTSQAIRAISEQKMFYAAAIGMEDTLIQYGFEVIARDIGNQKNNKTRFAVISDHNYESKATGHDVTSIVVDPKVDRVGLLCDVLEPISRKHSLNMASIHSRPNGKGGFIFYLDIEGHKSDEKVRECLNDIRSKLSITQVEVIGSYPYLPFNQH